MIRQQPQRMAAFKAPRGAERLFDLITVKDQKFLNSFYYVMKDTIVINDMKNATNLSQNYRVVTLQGEVFEINGVMSGGGRANKGLMSDKIVEEFTDEQI